MLEVCDCTDICKIPAGQPQPVASCRGLENQTTPAASDLRERAERLDRQLHHFRFDHTPDRRITALFLEFAAIRGEAWEMNAALDAPIVERVARALHEAHKPWCDYTYDFEHHMASREVYETLARAALSAIRSEAEAIIEQRMARATQAVLSIIGVDDRAVPSARQAVVSPDTQQMAADIARAVIEAIR